MRLFLLPISTRRTLIYCQRSATDDINAKPSLIDRATRKANETWVSLEKSETTWKRKITEYGNMLFRRIPFEEWGLKTIPPLSTKRKEAELNGKEKVEVLFPRLFLRQQKVPAVLEQLAMERQSLHRRRMWWSIIGIPFTFPVALLPVIPNLPGFYLAFRAYSHWKALRGAEHLQFLCENNIIRHSPSSVLDQLYAAGLMYPTRDISRKAPTPTPEQCEAVAKLTQRQTNDGQEDVMLIQQWNGKLMAERFKLPDMEIEIERAVEQVESKIKAKEELAEEKKEIENATAPPPKKKQRMKSS